MSQTWEALVAVALLGTDRQGTTPTVTEETIKAVLDQVNTEDIEGWVLSAAGTLAAYRQAGQKVTQATIHRVIPCELDSSTLFQSNSLPFFRSILDPEFQAILPEFLSLLQQTGQCIPPEYLPKLLDWGNAHAEVRSPLKSVIGLRGQWLARLNPKWAYAQATPEAPNPEDWQSLWETSDRIVRLNLLREWRSQNAETARELLVSTWKQETAKDRAAFLECLSEGLTLADEAFLEVGLGDRSKDVRVIAIELLARLPESQFSQQTVIRSSELIQFKTVDGNLQVEVALPKTDDPQWKDYEFKPQYFGQLNSKQGDRANLLIQILGITPLSTWEKAGSPEQLIRAIVNHDWELSIIQGWSLACERQRNSPWACMLLEWFGQYLSSDLNHTGAIEFAVQLLSLLPAEFRCQWITAWLNPLYWDHRIDLLLQTLPAPWGLDISQTLLRSVQKYLEAFEGEPDKEVLRRKRYMAYSLLPSMATCLHPDSLETPEMTQLRSLHIGDQAFDLEKTLNILQFRQQMYQVPLIDRASSG
jgi:Family of unknown function (DUF5691)